jgi:hypothetical protein
MAKVFVTPEPAAAKDRLPPKPTTKAKEKAKTNWSPRAWWPEEVPGTAREEFRSANRD